ncbi:MAG: SDR family NAD(P)-dependent oxidoreductase, partial [FCB group bacterium]
LAKTDSIEQIIAFLQANNINPDLLINNAGIGLYGGFEKTDGAKELKILQTNIIALTLLTKAMLKRMSEKDVGTILNVSSTIAFRKSPNWSVYAASKAFVLSFTHSLAIEFRKTPIKFALLCPGRTDTEFDKNAEAPMRRNNKGDNPDIVAVYTIKKLQKGKTLIIPGIKNKIKYIIFKYLPDFITDLVVKSL